MEAEPALLQPPYVDTAEAVRRFATGDLVFEPGARFDYVLSNWILVLAILEAVTGQPYPDAMRTLVLDPLRMTQTTPVAAPGTMSYRAVSPPVEWINPRPPFLAAAGGYYSTAADLLRFAHRVYDTDFLSRASRAALTTIEVASDNYALGGRIRTVSIGGVDVRAAWETGNTSGYRSVLGHRLDGRGAVVILNNTAISQRTMDAFAEALLQARRRARRHSPGQSARTGGFENLNSSTNLEIWKPMPRSSRSPPLPNRRGWRRFACWSATNPTVCRPVTSRTIWRSRPTPCRPISAS
ncbi:MAG: class A beta-lactamase-related serine hydrolase [Brevundimonas sp.]|nr:MAG: class A beta-lactamase-related serine hydrolase [Brevundimonas sp.]